MNGIIRLLVTIRFLATDEASAEVLELREASRTRAAGR
jgi:hypothetical protein